MYDKNSMGYRNLCMINSMGYRNLCMINIMGYGNLCMINRIFSYISLHINESILGNKIMHGKLQKDNI